MVILIFRDISERVKASEGIRVRRISDALDNSVIESNHFFRRKDFTAAALIEERFKVIGGHVGDSIIKNGFIGITQFL